MKSVLIRRAEVSDIPHLLPLIGKICALHQHWDDAKYGFLPQPERLYEDWLRKLIPKQKHLFLVAEVPDTPGLVAFLAATVEREIPVYHLKEYGFIDDIWVEEAYRQEGLGRQLMERAIAHFSNLGIAQIRLDTAIPNEAARRLFATCGFRPSNVEMLLETGQATTE